MTKLALLALLLPVAANAQFRSVRLTGGPKAEDRLRRFLASDASLRARLDDAAAREEAFLAEARESDLRDAVSGVSDGDSLRRELGRADGVRRSALLENLPGMKAPAPGSCVTLAGCATPELAADVPDAERLEDAVRRLVRPWMLLQAARGSSLEISAARDGDAVLTVRLRDLDAAPLTLNVAPRLLGGFKVWYDQPLVLAALYGRERDAALRVR